MRLLSWNVAGRVRDLPAQAGHVCGFGADVVCLQEVTPRTAPLWRHALERVDLPHSLVADPPPSDGRRRLSVMTAAREPLSAVPVRDVPWPERVLAVRIGAVEVINVHSPLSRHAELAKMRTHEVVAAHLAAGQGARLVCGDLNTPRAEHPDGTVWTFARDRRGRLRPDRGERWDRAERALLTGLAEHGFRDAFRAVHGPTLREISGEWSWWGGGFRLDHLIVSPEVSVETCAYLHDWRHSGLSDHSALTATLRVSDSGA